jgi:hypothetical protein
LALKGNNDAFESVAGLDPVTIMLLGKELFALLKFPNVELELALFADLNGLSTFPNILLLNVLPLPDIPNGEDVRKEAFPVSALLSKEPVAVPSSSSPSPWGCQAEAVHLITVYLEKLIVHLNLQKVLTQAQH